MPLPAALLKRLAKRGIVDSKSVKGDARVAAPAEEIIAENYDEVEEEPYESNYDYQPQSKKSRESFWSERLKRRIVDGSIAGYKGCPNKYNVYHKCSLFCVNTFGDGFKEPSKNYLKRKIRLLRRYPLPSDWKEVYDNGVGVFYYWNSVDDTVSWLPPSHSRAVTTKSAATLRKEMEATQSEVEENDETNTQTANEGMNVELPSGSSEQLTNNRELNMMTARSAPLKKPKARDLDKALRSKNERRQKKESADGLLDPMDPAAYSDIPRGKWSAGLENENKKTGVDSSVTGTLFQMRPYPSPGAVLQANAAAKSKNKDSENSDDGDNDIDDTLDQLN